MNTMIWKSDSMEPAIDFGDEINVTPTQGAIKTSGMYMMILHRAHMESASMRRLCAKAVKVIWRVKRLEDGRIALTCDNDGYSAMNAVMNEADFLRRWQIAGRVSVIKRNGHGLREMNSAAIPMAAMAHSGQMEVRV